MLSGYFAYCNLDTSGVKSFADDLAVRNGPVSSRVALLLRSAEGKPSFASISPTWHPPPSRNRGGRPGRGSERVCERQNGTWRWRERDGHGRPLGARGGVQGRPVDLVGLTARARALAGGFPLPQDAGRGGSERRRGGGALG